MSNLATELCGQEIFQTMGRITAVDQQGMLTVRTDRGDLRAKRAAGCLLEPRADDFVLVAGEPHSACYVLTVLERDDPRQAAIAHDGDLEIKLPSGRLRVVSEQGIDFVSPSDISFVAGVLRAHAGTAKLVMDKLSYLGRLVSTEVDKVKHEGGILETTLERISQRVQRSFRTVEEIDRVKAKRIDYAAEQVMALRAENAIVNAEQLVKVDGEQIHMG